MAQARRASCERAAVSVRQLGDRETDGHRRLGVVRQTDPAEHLTIGGHVYHHRTAAMKIDRNIG